MAALPALESVVSAGEAQAGSGTRNRRESGTDWRLTWRREQDSRTERSQFAPEKCSDQAVVDESRAKNGMVGTVAESHDASARLVSDHLTGCLQSVLH
jgi:hypothetical protein